MPRENDPDRKMSTREYREYCQGKHGNKSMNESLIKSIDRAVGGRTVTREELDQVHGKIKIGQEIKKDQ